MAVSILNSTLLFLLFQNTGSIQGVVISTTTSKPVPGAVISMTRMPDRPPGTGGVIAGVVGGVLTAGPAGRPDRTAATTDGSGSFSLQNLEAGTYVLSASANGYSQQQFGPATAGPLGMSANVTIAAGQSAKDVVLHLIPAGTITGRVTGGNGEPLVGMDVQLVRTNYQYNGATNLQQFGSAQTDDRGIYRLFWMPPGRYYVSVNPSNRPIPGALGFPAAANNKYPRTYYPGSADVAGAVQIDVEPGIESTGIDVRLAAQPSYSIRGRVVDSTSGQVPRNANISVARRDQMAVGIIGSNTQYNGNDGTFEVKDVLPGSYWIRAQLPLVARPEPGTNGRPPAPPAAMTAVEVTGNVDGIVLSTQPASRISGRLRVDGPLPPSNLTQIRISLQPATQGLFPSPPPLPAQVQEDGSFQLDSVGPGDYQVSVAGLGTNALGLYLKDARFGSTDVLREPLSNAGPTSTVLDVVLGVNGGQVSGTVSGGQQPAPRTQVVLVPDRRERRDLYKVAGTDPNGYFTIRAIPPGTYTAYAVDGSNFGLIFDPGLTSTVQPKGQHITVSDSSNLTVDLTLTAPPTK